MQTLDRQFVEHNAFALFERLMRAAKRWYRGCKAVHCGLKEKKGGQNSSAMWLLLGVNEVVEDLVLVRHLD